MINSCSGVRAPQTIALRLPRLQSPHNYALPIWERSALFQSGSNMEGYSNSYQNGTSARETEFQRLAQNVGTNVQKILQNGIARFFNQHTKTFNEKNYFQFLRCSVWSARLGQHRTTSSFRTNFTRSSTTLGRSYFVIQYDILYMIKSNLTYTGQLAKDTSSQLKELNSYPPEQALDPRWSLMETLRSESLARWWS